MSEEEVIKQIKDMIIAFDVQGYIREKGFIKEELKASNVLQEMLDIYKKQKEEIERLKNAEEYAKLGKETLLDAIHKQEKEIEELKEINKQQFLNYEAKIDKMEYEMGYDYISKDKVLKALGYEENDEEYKRIYNKEELILSLIRTINEECDRLEDIEDQKTMLEIHNIENQRDKYWQDKIRDKIKDLEEIDEREAPNGWESERDYAKEKLNELLED